MHLHAQEVHVHLRPAEQARRRSTTILHSGYDSPFVFMILQNLATESTAAQQSRPGGGDDVTDCIYVRLDHSSPTAYVPAGFVQIMRIFLSIQLKRRMSR